MVDQDRNQVSGTKTKWINVMHKLLLAVLLTSTFGFAHANSLSIVNQEENFSITGYNGNPLWIATGYKTAGAFGALSASTTGTLSVTYLGNSGLWLDQLRFGSSAGGGILDEACCIGRSITAQVGAGVVDFQFEDDHGGVTVNGSPSSSVPPQFAFLLDNLQSTSFAASFIYKDVNYNFQYLLGFNDNFSGDFDYDDFVVGVNFAPSSVVPLPAAAWLFGSAILGFVSLANRRRV